MRNRQNLSRKQSNRNFQKGNRVHAKNNVRPMRGGFRA